MNFEEKYGKAMFNEIENICMDDESEFEYFRLIDTDISDEYVTYYEGHVQVGEVTIEFEAEAHVNFNTGYDFDITDFSDDSLEMF